MTPTLDYLRGSDGSGNASLMTVQSVRAAGATTITVNTTTGVAAKFIGSMGTPHTFTDPVTGEVITIISEESAVDFAGHIDSGKVEIDSIAPGYTDKGSKVGDIIIIRPTTQWADVVADSLQGTITARDELLADSIVSGTGLVTVTSGREVATSNITYYMSGIRLTKTGIPNKTLTATKDTYGYIDTAGTVTWVEVTVNATPTAPAGFIPFVRATTNASAVTSIVLMSRGTVAKNYSPSAILTFSNPTVGDVFNTGNNQTVTLDNFKTNRPDVLSRPAVGKIAVAESGYYSITFSLYKIDAANSVTLSPRIRYIPGGVGAAAIATIGQTASIAIGNAGVPIPSLTSTVPLEAGSIIQGDVSIGGGIVRLAVPTPGAGNPTDMYLCSLSVIKVGEL